MKTIMKITIPFFIVGFIIGVINSFMSGKSLFIIIFAGIFYSSLLTFNAYLTYKFYLMIKSDYKKLKFKDQHINEWGDPPDLANELEGSD